MRRCRSSLRLSALALPGRQAPRVKMVAPPSGRRAVLGELDLELHLLGRNRVPADRARLTIGLLRTFADHAVIAIENVRLFKELEARTQELTRSVGELRALGEVGQVVSSSLDLETVRTTIVSQAVQLSGLDGGTVFEYEERAEEFVQRATTGTARVMAGRGGADGGHLRARPGVGHPSGRRL